MTSRDLQPYLPRLAIEWLAESPDETLRQIEGTVAFVDVSGFTKLSERLAKRGKVGAEELTDTIGSCFRELLAVAYDNGGSLIKFGGDALLLLFRGEGHAVRACRAAVGMRTKLRTVGDIQTPGGRVKLRMSVGVHSGVFDFFLVGEHHRELIITGPAATQTTLMEQAAEAGEIVVSPETAAALPAKLVGDEKGPGRLLRGAPPGETPATDATDYLSRDPDLNLGVPDAIREHILGGGSEPEHRQATVIFIRYEGSDEVIPVYGAGVMAERLSKLVTLAQKAAAEYGVTFLGTDIDKNGGKIILVAGAPRSTGADEEAALLAARKMIEGQSPLPIRIGINRGHVFAGDIGPGYRRTYTVMGDPVNLAARLMAAATPRQIYATGEVLERSRSRFDAQPLEPFMVKGKAKPVQAFTVGSASGESAEADSVELPLIGRDVEMASLVSALESARTGNGRVVELVGEAGIGKSRLVDELLNRAEEIRVLSANGGPYAAATPYFPFRTLARIVAGISADEQVADAVEHLRRVVDSAAPDLLPWLPLLGIVMDLPIQPTAETLALNQEFRRAQLERTVTDFFGVMLKAPTLFVLEDVHFFDDGSRGLLRSLATAAGDHPWLVVSTHRVSAEGHAVPEGSHVTTLGIGPLAPADAAAMAEAAAQVSPLSDDVLQTIVARSGGNPLFLAELVVAARRADSGSDLPDSVEALMMARIDLLPPRDRTVVRSASVLGTVFDAALLDAVIDDEHTTQDDALWRRLSEYVRQESGNRFRFASALIRDAAYEGLTYKRRQELHAKAAEAILKTSEHPDDVAELLSLHYFHAQRNSEAWRFARLAGRRAQEKYANAEAARFFSQAIEAGRRLPTVASSDIVEAYEMLGDSWKAAGEFRLSENAYRAARRVMSGDDLSDARLVFKEALIAEKLGNHALALRRLTRVRKMIGHIGTAEALKQHAQASAWYTEILAMKGQHRRAIRWARDAISEAERARERDALARASAMLDLALESVGKAGDYDNMRKALEIYEELDDINGQTIALNNLGQGAYFAGQWDRAIDLYERARLGREKIGDPVGAAVGTFNIAEILSDQGRVDEAEPLLRRVLRVWRAAGDSAGVPYALSQLGRVAARAGRFEEALSLYEEAREGFTQLGHGADVIETEARIAECLVLNGDAREALTLLKNTIARDRARGGVTPHAPLLYRCKGYALMQLGDFVRSREAFDESLAAADKRQAEHEMALTLRAIGQLARRMDSRDIKAEEESDRILARLGIRRCADPPPLFRRRDGAEAEAVAEVARS